MMAEHREAIWVSISNILETARATMFEKLATSASQGSTETRLRSNECASTHRSWGIDSSTTMYIE